MYEGHTKSGAAVTGLVLAIFRLNGCLLAAGDRITGDIGLTSARWQVLGAIALAPEAQPVTSLARSMGLARQSVQRIVNELAADGFVVFRPNPQHVRAKLVLLTKQGVRSYRAATERQVPWANRLGAGLRERDIKAATNVARALAESLEAAEERRPARRT